MKKRSLYITLLAALLILFGLIGSLFLDEGIANRVIGVITTGTAIIGAVALFYQFKRDKSLNEASFLVEYGQQFYSVYDCADLMNELEKCRANPDYILDTERYYKKIVGYLEWVETFASLVNDGLLQIRKIDNVMSYRYFLIVNNRQVQERELVKFREFYRSIYVLYPKWVKYKKDNRLPVVLEENALSATEGFAELLASTPQ